MSSIPLTLVFVLSCFTHIARVYAILAGQLGVTALSVFLFGTVPSLSNFFKNSGAIVPVLSLILSTFAWMFMAVNDKARRASPIKYQLLALFTLGEALCVGFLSSFYTFSSVVSALLATTTAASGVSLYSILRRNSTQDLSQWGSTLSSLGLIFVFYGFIQLLQVMHVLPAGFLPYNDALYGMAGAGLFAFYMAYHTRTIVSGKYTKHQMNKDDHVFGAMTLYNDIVNMFIYILKVIGEDREPH